MANPKVVVQGRPDDKVDCVFTKKELARCASAIYALVNTPGGPRSEVTALQDLRRKILKLLEVEDG